MIFIDILEKEKKKVLRQNVKPYERTDLNRSIIQMLNSLVPLFLMIGISAFLFHISWLLAILCSCLASGFLVRTFILFHDCCHGSFFKKQKNNRLLGNLTGFLTFFPYKKWRREHLIHHAGSGNLEKRGIGDIWTMTVDEYKVSSNLNKVKYRLYRNPVVMFLLGPIFLVFVSNRCNVKSAKKDEKRNTWLNNILLILVHGVLFYLMGPFMYCSVIVPVVFLAGVAGIWLFYIQHTFEDTYFEESSEWDYVKAAIDGSSYYKLPKILQWITGNIGYHHVHHYSPRIPNYLLQDTHKNVSALQNVTTISLKESMFSLKYKLYDASNKKFITFREYNLLK